MQMVSTLCFSLFFFVFYIKFSYTSVSTYSSICCLLQVQYNCQCKPHFDAAFNTVFHIENGIQCTVCITRTKPWYSYLTSFFSDSACSLACATAASLAASACSLACSTMAFNCCAVLISELIICS